ncbi:hypothetical protein LP7551_01747 [Roseibium album]|nr:hypothetical protein LP7551_01747 [Roseibium album]
MPIRSFGLLILMLAGLAGNFSWADEVRYPMEAGRIVEDSFPFQVLKLALQKAEGEWSLVPSPAGPMNERRSKILLARGHEVDVAWYGTSAKVEEKLQPVRIPISGGLLGWRVLLINRNDQHKFSQIDDFEQLKSFVFVQGAGWSDIEILEGAGLTVATYPYADLFSLAASQHEHVFSRGVEEVYEEMNLYTSSIPDLALEQSLALRYSFARLFFVQIGNEKLHNAIYEGLVKAHEDGSYQALFDTHPSNWAALNKINLEDRKIFKIPNVTMSAETLAIDKKYWFQP